MAPNNAIVMVRFISCSFVSVFRIVRDALVSRESREVSPGVSGTQWHHLHTVAGCDADEPRRVRDSFGRRFPCFSQEVFVNATRRLDEQQPADGISRVLEGVQFSLRDVDHRASAAFYLLGLDEELEPSLKYVVALVLAVLHVGRRTAFGVHLNLEQGVGASGSPVGHLARDQLAPRRPRSRAVIRSTVVCSWFFDLHPSPPWRVSVLTGSI